MERKTGSKSCRGFKNRLKKARARTKTKVKARVKEKRREQNRVGFNSRTS